MDERLKELLERFLRMQEADVLKLSEFRAYCISQGASCSQATATDLLDDHPDLNFRGDNTWEILPTDWAA